MRKENEAIKKKYSLQIQDLRRQLVTKKAFDEDESQREISRLKKELHFIQMTLYDAKRNKGGFNTLSNENMNTDNQTKSTKPTGRNHGGVVSGAPSTTILEDLEHTQKKMSTFRDDDMGGHGGDSYLSSEVM
mgnify:CR=1 FL=1